MLCSFESFCLFLVVDMYFYDYWYLFSLLFLTSEKCILCWLQVIIVLIIEHSTENEIIWMTLTTVTEHSIAQLGREERTKEMDSVRNDNEDLININKKSRVNIRVVMLSFWNNNKNECVHFTEDVKSRGCSWCLRRFPWQPAEV